MMTIQPAPLSRFPRWWILYFCVLLALGTPTTRAQETTVTLRTLHAFKGSDGATPAGGLLRASDGNFYGSTFAGGNASETGGTIFRLTPAGVLTTLVNFAGNQPTSPLIQGTDGNFYGTTSVGGQGGNGIAFQLSASGTSLKVLTSFYPDKTGSKPLGGLRQGRDLAFYGTTSQGGPSGGGAVFQITSQGGLSVLHGFSAAKGEGTHSYGTLVQGIDGNFYGTTSADGARGGGTIFRFSPLGGSYADIYHFTGGADGASPRAGLLVGGDGNLYGTTSIGGSGGSGTVFQLTPQGTLTILHAFTGGVDGGKPTAPLVDGGDGNFYGSTDTGGLEGSGTIFSIKISGEFSMFYTFSGDADGAKPVGPLALGGDGILYGAASAGGPNKEKLGTLFRLNLRTPPLIPGALAFETTNLTVSGTAESASLVVNRVNGESGPVSVAYTTQDGGAKAGADYQATSGVVGWIDGDSKPRAITVPIINRGLSDRVTRTFSVVLSSPQGGATLGEASTATVGIVADNPPFLPTVTLSVLGDGTATVGGKAARIVFSRDGGTTKELTISYKLKGKARNGVDYQYLPGTFTIPADSSKAKLKIKARAGSLGKASLKLVLMPLAPEDGSYQIETAKVKLKVVSKQ